jgi:hypothetical protein
MARIRNGSAVWVLFPTTPVDSQRSSASLAIWIAVWHLFEPLHQSLSRQVGDLALGWNSDLPLRFLIGLEQETTIRIEHRSQTISTRAYRTETRAYWHSVVSFRFVTSTASWIKAFQSARAVFQKARFAFLLDGSLKNSSSPRTIHLPISQPFIESFAPRAFPSSSHSVFVIPTIPARTRVAR